eukprot:GHVN01082877.1.p1 GENE.GHVN01082877.1~~GHVN01082877.1.p1  ORF type:complete len:1469 (-),score=47.65 GHVN01082877.1:3-4325(-)
MHTPFSEEEGPAQGPSPGASESNNQIMLFAEGTQPTPSYDSFGEVNDPSGLPDANIWPSLRGSLEKVSLFESATEAKKEEQRRSKSERKKENRRARHAKEAAFKAASAQPDLTTKLRSSASGAKVTEVLGFSNISKSQSPDEAYDYVPTFRRGRQSVSDVESDCGASTPSDEAERPTDLEPIVRVRRAAQPLEDFSDAESYRSEPSYWKMSLPAGVAPSPPDVDATLEASVLDQCDLPLYPADTQPLRVPRRHADHARISREPSPMWQGGALNFDSPLGSSRYGVDIAEAPPGYEKIEFMLNRERHSVVVASDRSLSQGLNGRLNGADEIRLRAHYRRFHCSHENFANPPRSQAAAGSSRKMVNREISNMTGRPSAGFFHAAVWERKAPALDLGAVRHRHHHRIGWILMDVNVLAKPRRLRTAFVTSAKGRNHWARPSGDGAEERRFLISLISGDVSEFWVPIKGEGHYFSIDTCPEPAAAHYDGIWAVLNAPLSGLNFYRPKFVPTKMSFSHEHVVSWIEGSSMCPKNIHAAIKQELALIMQYTQVVRAHPLSTEAGLKQEIDDLREGGSLFSLRDSDDLKLLSASERLSKFWEEELSVKTPPNLEDFSPRTPEFCNQVKEWESTMIPRSVAPEISHETCGWRLIDQTGVYRPTEVKWARQNSVQVFVTEGRSYFFQGIELNLEKLPPRIWVTYVGCTYQRAYISLEKTQRRRNFVAAFLSRAEHYAKGQFSIIEESRRNGHGQGWNHRIEVHGHVYGEFQMPLLCPENDFQGYSRPGFSELNAEIFKIGVLVARKGNRGTVPPTLAESLRRKVEAWRVLPETSNVVLGDSVEEMKERCVTHREIPYKILFTDITGILRFPCWFGGEAFDPSLGDGSMMTDLIANPDKIGNYLWPGVSLWSPERDESDRLIEEHEASLTQAHRAQDDLQPEPSKFKPEELVSEEPRSVKFAHGTKVNSPSDEFETTSLSSSRLRSTKYGIPATSSAESAHQGPGRPALSRLRSKLRARTERNLQEFEPVSEDVTDQDKQELREAVQLSEERRAKELEARESQPPGRRMPPTAVRGPSKIVYTELLPQVEPLGKEMRNRRIMERLVGMPDFTEVGRRLPADSDSLSYEEQVEAAQEKLEAEINGAGSLSRPYLIKIFLRDWLGCPTLMSGFTGAEGDRLRRRVYPTALHRQKIAAAALEQLTKGAPISEGVRIVDMQALCTNYIVEPPTRFFEELLGAFVLAVRGGVHGPLDYGPRSFVIKEGLAEIGQEIYSDFFVVSPNTQDVGKVIRSHREGTLREIATGRLAPSESLARQMGGLQFWPITEGARQLLNGPKVTSVQPHYDECRHGRPLVPPYSVIGKPLLCQFWATKLYGVYYERTGLTFPHDTTERTVIESMRKTDSQRAGARPPAGDDAGDPRSAPRGPRGDTPRPRQRPSPRESRRRLDPGAW